MTQGMARGEELPCDQLPCEETLFAADAEMKVEESLSDPSASGDGSSVVGDTRQEEPQCEKHLVIQLGQKLHLIAVQVFLREPHSVE